MNISAKRMSSTKLLLHVCCGPCAVWPLQTLGAAADMTVTGLFYNPNIHPETEFSKRMDSVKKLFDETRAPIFIREDYMRREWEAFEQTNGYFNGDVKKRLRCEMCYHKRISFTAATARERGFNAFSTTLLISPYQNHKLVAAICDEQARINGVAFFYNDFRPYFREGQKIAREMDLYRQKYCGCIFSTPE